jgi:hypothetical protein
MTELDEVWSQMLTDVGERADMLGRAHVAEYLRLRATNDAIRARGVGWLIETFIAIAAEEQRARRDILIEREEPYRFGVGSSTMRGALVSVRHGVRHMQLEAGWPRTPSDGIVREGALAVARISHFGMPRETAMFRLVHAASLPNWLDADDIVVDTAALARHFRVFSA